MSQNGSYQEVTFVIGIVESCNQTPQDRQQDGQPTKYNVFLTLAGGCRLMAIDAEADKFPAVGSLAVFESVPSRSGKMAMIQRWGWVDTKKAGPLKGDNYHELLTFDWQFVVNRRQSQYSGVTR